MLLLLSSQSDALAGVTRQLRVDYPDRAMKWLADVRWEKPQLVPLDKINYNDNIFDRIKQHEQDKVATFAKRIQGGWKKPVILIKRPGVPLLKPIDGHTRITAHHKLKKPVLAWIGTVDRVNGPWDDFHKKQIQTINSQHFEVLEFPITVRTAAGEEFFKQPIGSVVYRDEPGPFYHGSSRRVIRGQIATGTRPSNQGKWEGWKSQHNYFTSDFKAAADYARFHSGGKGPPLVHIVAPTGEYGNDPAEVAGFENGYRSKDPLKVLGSVRVPDWTEPYDSDKFVDFQDADTTHSDKYIVHDAEYEADAKRWRRELGTTETGGMWSQVLEFPITVRTPAGERFYHAAIGTVVYADSGMGRQALEDATYSEIVSAHTHQELLDIRRELQAKHPRTDPLVRKIRKAVTVSRQYHGIDRPGEAESISSQNAEYIAPSLGARPEGFPADWDGVSEYDEVVDGFKVKYRQLGEEWDVHEMLPKLLARIDERTKHLLRNRIDQIIVSDNPYDEGIRVGSLVPNDTLGFWNEDTGTLFINGSKTEELDITTLHEIMHAYNNLRFMPSAHIPFQELANKARTATIANGEMPFYYTPMAHGGNVEWANSEVFAELSADYYLGIPLALVPGKPLPADLQNDIKQYFQQVGEKPQLIDAAQGNRVGCIAVKRNGRIAYIDMIRGTNLSGQVDGIIELPITVRTPAGAAFYKQPIGTVVYRDAPGVEDLWRNADVDSIVKAHSHDALLALRADVQDAHDRDDPVVKKIRAAVVASRKAGRAAGDSDKWTRENQGVAAQAPQPAAPKSPTISAQAPAPEPTDPALAEVDARTKEVTPKLTSDEKGTLDYYVSMTGYQNINGRARGIVPPRKIFGRDTPQEGVENLDSAFEKVPPLQKSIDVYRGIADTRPLDIGSTFTDKGFVSTTTSADKALQYAEGMLGAKEGDQPAVVHIAVPAGSKAISTELFRSDPRTMNEVLLPRNTTFKVLSENQDSSGMRHIYATVEHGEPAAIEKLQKAESSGAPEVSQPKVLGNIADVVVETYADGSRWVRKSDIDVDEADNEELASKISDIVGAGAPEVLERSDSRNASSFVMPFVEGKTAAELMTTVTPEEAKMSQKERWAAQAKRKEAAKKKIDAIKKSEQGKRIGLLDILIQNYDRHDGNWIITPNDVPVPIDHSNAWATMGDEDEDEVPDDSPFSVGLTPSDFTEPILDRIASELKKLREGLTGIQQAKLDESIKRLKDWRSGKLVPEALGEDEDEEEDYAPAAKLNRTQRELVNLVLDQRGKMLQALGRAKSAKEVQEAVDYSAQLVEDSVFGQPFDQLRKQLEAWAKRMRGLAKNPKIAAMELEDAMRLARISLDTILEAIEI